MNTIRPFTILSGDRADLPDDENAQRTEFLTRQLQNENIQTLPVRGRFAGTPEHSVLVFDTDEYRDETVHRLANAYHQDSLLHVDANRRASLESLQDGTRTELGTFREVSASEAASLRAFTQTSDGRFFAAVAA